jgi:kumamolisin
MIELQKRYFLGIVFALYLAIGTQAQAAPGGLTLDQVRAAYGIDKLMQTGIDGHGQTVAILAVSGFLQSDIDTFVKRYHLPTPDIQVKTVGKVADTPELEYTMDTEIVDAMAPGATLFVYEGLSIVNPKALDGKTKTTLDAVLSDGQATIISLSYDSCELDFTPQQAKVILDITHQIHDAGITFYHGAGDYGAYRCASDSNSAYATTPAVNFIAASPYVTALGGTTLSMTGTQYGSEIVWVNTQKKSGTGGGLSTHFPLPDYQVPFLLKDANPKSMRQVPDAAADADPNSGFPFYFSAASAGWINTGGDSATAPLWAGATALVNQYLDAHLKDLKGGPFRLHAPEDLYRLAAAYAQGKVDLPPFHDITEGDNLYYKAGKGYDLTTGLGTPDFYNIALDMEKLYRAGSN